MSDESQQYSIDNQKAAIADYASRYGFSVIKTYADAGKSGVIAANRSALGELLADVVGGKAMYKAILVYDVSRWGRFPDVDEAAHYEFLCSRSGIPLHYCAEQFLNDGAVSSSLLKAVKRTMAAEFSRELGEKVFRGKSRLVQLGYWVGGQAGYAYQRLMVSAEGNPKQLMRFGESKSLTTDRVILVPGPKEQVECVKQMFMMIFAGMGCGAIAHHFNGKGISHYGKLWRGQDVFDIITHPKYAGWNVWNRSTSRMRSKEQQVDRSEWITRKGAFEPIIDQKAFDRAQKKLPKQADFLWSDEAILRKLKSLLKAKGRLSESLIQNAKGMPCARTIADHFGSYRNAYAAVGYTLPKERVFQYEQSKRTLRLRERLANKIAHTFPGRVKIIDFWRKPYSILQVDNKFLVSVLLCRQKKRKGLHWEIAPHPSQRANITLICRMNRLHTGILSYHLFPQIDFSSHRSYKNDPWLSRGLQLDSLFRFCDLATKIWDLRQSLRRNSAICGLSAIPSPIESSVYGAPRDANKLL